MVSTGPDRDQTIFVEEFWRQFQAAAWPGLPIRRRAGRFGGRKAWLMIVLIVHFTVKAGEEQRAQDYIRTMQEHTRQEPGCRRYVGHQSTQDPRRFCFYEVYDDEAALDAHRAAPYFAQYVTNGLREAHGGEHARIFTPVE